MNDKEKIQYAIDYINHFLKEIHDDAIKNPRKKRRPILWSDVIHIKSILKTGKLPDYN